MRRWYVGDKVYCRDCRFCERIEGMAWRAWCAKHRKQVFLSKAAFNNSCAEAEAKEKVKA